MSKEREKVILLSESDYVSVCTSLHNALCRLEKAEPSYLVGEVTNQVKYALEFLETEE